MKSKIPARTLKLARHLYLAIVFCFLLSGNAALSEAPDAEPIQPLPPAPALDPKQVELGRKLFSDSRLSKNNSISCVSCHDLSNGGADHKPKSVGIGGAVAEVNTPTVLNAALNFRQFWDGRAANLEDQIDGPVNNPKEMGSSWAEVVAKLKDDLEYRKQFFTAYNEEVSATRIKEAIAAFERSLLTPDSGFDRYLRGDASAISKNAKEGYGKFKKFGCIACHQGVNVGGNLFQSMGVMGDYFKDRKTEITNADLGRFNVTGRASDKHVFKVPGLRNVELTAPYFHDGTAASLEDAVKKMAKYQLGRKLSKEDLEQLVQFLKSLTGKAPDSIASALNDHKKKSP